MEIIWRSQVVQPEVAKGEPGSISVCSSDPQPPEPSEWCYSFKSGVKMELETRAGQRKQFLPKTSEQTIVHEYTYNYDF
jgi:hypothetical protein